MQSGLLWYDTRLTKEFDLVLNQAAARYQQKFGVKPNTCFISILHSALANVVRSGIEIRIGKYTPPNHIWLGVKE